VLALLGDDEAEAQAVLERAIELADTERARLMLAKTTDPGCLVRWCSPLAPLCRVAPVTEPDVEAIAYRRLVRAAEAVPASIPLSTVVLPVSTAAALRKLARQAPFDLVVVGMDQLERGLRLRRELRRLGVCALAVTPDSLAGAGSPPVSGQSDPSRADIRPLAT
jgi:nucleotide-binding universal stress UspA family protein